MVSFRTINWFSLKTISRTFQVLCIKFKLKLCLNVLKPATAINALVVLFLNHNTYFRSVLSLEGKTGQVKNIELNQQQKFLLLRKLTTEIIHKSSFSFSSEKRKKNCQMVNTTFRTRLWLKLSNPGGRSQNIFRTGCTRLPKIQTFTKPVLYLKSPLLSASQVHYINEKTLKITICRVNKTETKF